MTGNPPPAIRTLAELKAAVEAKPFGRRFSYETRWECCGSCRVVPCDPASKRCEQRKLRNEHQKVYNARYAKTPGFRRMRAAGLEKDSERRKAYYAEDGHYIRVKQRCRYHARPEANTARHKDRWQKAKAANAVIRWQRTMAEARVHHEAAGLFLAAALTLGRPLAKQALEHQERAAKLYAKARAIYPASPEESSP